jgi:pimeloyl-ACP methyl ester carboxylesterase
MPAHQISSDFVWTFFPGLHGTDDLFTKLRSYLPDTLDCEWINLPTKGKQDYDKLRDWLDDELPRLDDKKRILIAESFSGPLALMLASHRVDEIAGIVLAASFCDAPMNPGIALLPLRPLFMVKPPRKALEHFLIGTDSSDADVAELTQIIQSIPSSTLSKRIRAALELEEEDSPQLSGVPMLILQAQHDNLIPWEAQQRLEARYPKARVHWLEAPHMILQKHPKACLEKITEFLADLA